jgi:hypothetical protein
MKKLIDGQQIRTDMDKYRPEIFVKSIEGYRRSRNASPEEVAASYEKTKNDGHPTAWTFQSPACITADYPGKAAKLAADKAAYEAADLVKNGEIVEIEGRLYRTVYMGIQYSDPVKFMELSKEEAESFKNIEDAELA